MGLGENSNITNEQLFEFMRKMYSDVNGKIDNMDREMQEVKENMATKHDIARLENKMDTNHKALYDGYKLTYEKLTMLEEKVDKIDKKLKVRMLK